MKTKVCTFLLYLSLVDARLFTVPFESLSIVAKDHLENVLEEDGAFAVSNLPAEYVKAVRKMQENAPSCLQESGSPSYELPDGSLRTTFARESENGQEFPLCLGAEAALVEEYFDTVDRLVTSMIADIVGEERVGWTHPEGDITTAEYKEHVHVYSGHDGGHADLSVPYHTDNGLMLMVTHYPEHPLVIKNRHGGILDTHHLEDDTIIVILGSALPHWLLHADTKLHAAAHAVPALASGNRTVLARMKVDHNSIVLWQNSRPPLDCTSLCCTQSWPQTSIIW